MVGRNPKVLVDRQTVPHTWHLILNADAEPRYPVLGLTGDVGSFEKNSAAGRAQLAGEHFEERALAGAVRSDQAAQLAAPQSKINRSDRADATEILGEPSRL
jgi:hypothetical protein